MYHFFTDKNTTYIKHLSTKSCAKYKYYEQLTKMMLIKFETVVFFTENNINFELYGC